MTVANFNLRNVHFGLVFTNVYYYVRLMSATTRFLKYILSTCHLFNVLDVMYFLTCLFQLTD